jgi:hypothetical protein
LQASGEIRTRDCQIMNAILDKVSFAFEFPDNSNPHAAVMRNRKRGNKGKAIFRNPTYKGKKF